MLKEMWTVLVRLTVIFAIVWFIATMTTLLTKVQVSSLDEEHKPVLVMTEK